MAEITQREDCLYIFKIESTGYKNNGHKVQHLLSDEHIFFDKGRAIYYRGFDNPYILIGMFRTIFNEPIRSLMMQTGHKVGDVFEVSTGNMQFITMWTGDWNPLERIGFIGTMFNTQMLQTMINEILQSYEDNGHVLKDRG